MGAMPKRATLASGGALAALLLLACGDDRLPPERYFPRAQAVADDLIEAVHDAMVAFYATDPDLGEQALVDAARSFFTGYGAAYDEAADGLASLSPPDDATAAHAEALAEMRALADGIRGISGRLADTATLDDMRAVLASPDLLPEREAAFPASEGLERVAAAAGQSFDWDRAAEPIIEATASYNDSLKALVVALTEDIAVLASAFIEAGREAGGDTDALTEAIGAYLGGTASRHEAFVAEIELLSPPDLLRNLHDLFIEETRNTADVTREMAERIDAAADYDEVRAIVLEYAESLGEVDAILATAPELFGQPPPFTAACEAVGRVVTRIGFPLGFVCAVAG